MRPVVTVLALAGALAVLVALAGCAPGAERFEAEPAGFWAGLWHGIICVVTFVIGLFTDTVRMYEVNNSGGWYDFGFLLGAVFVAGAALNRRRGPRRFKELPGSEWDELGRKIERKVRDGIRHWLDESGKADDEWREIGRKIEERIKRELRDWAER